MGGADVEAKLFEGDVAEVSTFAFHEHRERAPHLEQSIHRGRLVRAAQLVTAAAARLRSERGWDSGSDSDIDVWVSDLGCGDGGLLQLLKAVPAIAVWGYDFAPANRAGWAERGVDGRDLDVFNDQGAAVSANAELGDIVVMTEVLEHLSRPHEVLRYLVQVTPPGLARYVVASSPWTETAESHDGCHAWCWDMIGYRDMFVRAGFDVVQHDTVGMFQLVMARTQR